MSDFPEHVRRNRALWDDWAQQYVAAGEAAWAQDLPTWGIWSVPESQVGMFPDDLAGQDAIELGCGTAYISAWLARRGACVVGIDNSEAQLATVRRLQQQYGGAYQSSGNGERHEVEAARRRMRKESEGMARTKKVLPEGVKVIFEAVTGRSRGRGIFGIEDEGDAVARQAKLQRMAERIGEYDRGYEGNRRRCSQWGQWQQYKGDVSREGVVEGGTLTVLRAYYVCRHCHTASYPLDEQLGFGEEHEQGRLREKLALVAVLVPYHQAPHVCQTLLGSERYARSLRRVALREAARLTKSGHQHTLRKRDHDRIYLQIDGHLCPTREPRQGAEDQGYRAAKAVMAFSQADVAEVSKERHDLLAKVLKAQLMECEAFRPLVQDVYQQAHGPQAAEVIVLADGAHWSWNLVTELLPHAIPILDFSHAKHYLWEAAKLIYGADSAFVRPWVKEREELLFADKIEQVITHLQHFVDLAPGVASIIHYFQQNQERMRYGTYQQRGYFIGSGAIESAGKQLTAARIKGPGMRWNVTDLNALLSLRCIFLEHSWSTYWDAQAQRAA